ncbi:MAG: hypothetical protein M3522_12455 [Actinomycetota bacterium]|nr:hypothetical protein [Actinomycetota bacterium]
MPRRGDRASDGGRLSAADFAALAVPLAVIVAAVLISFVAGFALGSNREDRAGSPELGPIDVVPTKDLPGEDVPGLGRYPGAVRVEYESHLLGDARVTEVGYLARGDSSEAGDFYERRLEEDGWSFEGSDFDAGELALRARRGGGVLVIELEQQDEMVEIEMEFSEPPPS